MAQPDSSRMFDAQLHPRVPAGAHGGGEFGKKGGAKKTTEQAKQAPRKSEPAKQPAKPLGPLTKTLAFDAKNNRGPGYGVKGGDPHVKKIQAELNKLGLTDLHGKKLQVDGELGPLTTQSIKAAQRRLGLTPNGQVTPALYSKLAATKELPKAAKAVAKPVPKRADELDGQERMADAPTTDASSAMSDDECEQALMELLAGMSDEDIHDLANTTDDALADAEAN